MIFLLQYKESMLLGRTLSSFMKRCWSSNLDVTEDHCICEKNVSKCLTLIVIITLTTCAIHILHQSKLLHISVVIVGYILEYVSPVQFGTYILQQMCRTNLMWCCVHWVCGSRWNPASHNWLKCSDTALVCKNLIGHHFILGDLSV